MFDHTLYNKIRKTLNCEEAFPEIYDKVSRSARIQLDRELADITHDSSSMMFCVLNQGKSDQINMKSNYIIPIYVVFFYFLFSVL